MIETAGWVVLASLPFVFLVISYMRDGSRFLAACIGVVFLMWTLGLGPAALGIAISGYAPQSADPWIVLLCLASWPTGAFGLMWAMDALDER